MKLINNACECLIYASVRNSVLCSFRRILQKTKQNEAHGATLHKPQQAQGNIRDLQPAVSPLDPVRAFGHEMRDPGTALSCFDLVLPLRLHYPPGG